MALTLKDFVAYKEGHVSREDTVRIVSQNPTEISVLQSQMKTHEERFGAIVSGVLNYEQGRESAVLSCEVDFRDTLLSKIDTMKMEPNLDTTMIARIEEMESFLNDKAEVISEIIDMGKERLAKMMERTQEDDDMFLAA